MADFEQAVAEVLKHEGGYSNNPDDPGGETKFGIAKKYFPGVNVAELTEDQAKGLYRINFWSDWYDKINSQHIATKLMDLSVNVGKITAVRMLQEAAGITADGLFGEKTLQAINKADAAVLLAEFRARAAQHYAVVCIAYPAQREFLLGWMRRAVA